MKKPDILLLNDTGAAFDAQSQVRLVERILVAFQGNGVIWALPRPDLATKFETALVIRGGKVVEQGAVADLDRDGTAFREMTAAG